jgi:preprotein translocase subunit SecA
MAMLGFLNKLFDSNEKVVKQYRLRVDQINQLEPEFKSLSDEDLKNKTAEFKHRLVMVNCSMIFCLKRLRPSVKLPDGYMGMRHFDVQLMAGIGFHEGKVTEQKTGEGKTLSATSALISKRSYRQGSTFGHR